MRVSDLNKLNESDELLAKMTGDVKKEYQALLVKEEGYLTDYKRARGALQKQLALDKARDTRHTIMDFLYKHNLITD